MTSPRRALILSYSIFGLAIICFIVAIAMDPTIHGLRGIDTLQQAEKTQPSENPIVPQNVQEPAQNTSPEPSEAVDPVSTPTAPAHPAAPAMSDEEFQSKQQGGHVPFTSQPVTPGDPESYVDTVGQCPFYEMAGPKGCYPPADIECNADWSVCTPRQP